MTKVCIEKSDYSDVNIDTLLAPLGGITAFVRKGDRVLLKMNLLSAREPEQAVTTHPALVRAAARAVIEAGGIPFIGDSPAGKFTRKSLENAYTHSGIAALAKEESIRLNEDTSSIKMSFPEGRRLKSSSICRFIQEADKIIALPKLKTHSFQYMTLACKIMYGIVPGLTKGAYHARFPTRAAFADMLLDLLTEVKPDLTIMDGIVAMEGQGPANGDPVRLGLVMAAVDPVAMDIAVCNILGIEPVGIPVLKRAKLRKWWPETIDYPQLKPEDVYREAFKLPNTAAHLVTGKRLLGKSPVVTKKCVGCGDCETICPKNAIAVESDVAKVDYGACIRCYCCHEVCPEDAIILSAKKPK
ncbi:MAG: DUF362 domain-containing protein [Desulfobacterales bacterium]